MPAVTFWLLVITALIFATGCKTLKKIEQPKKSWVDASREAHDFIAPKFIEYVKADQSLTVFEKQLFVQAVSDWEFMVREGEKAVEDSGRIFDVPTTPEVPR